MGTQLKPNIKYVALAYNAWDSIVAVTPASLPIAPIGKSTGFLLAFDSIADLRRDFPKSAYITIIPAPHRKGGRKRP